MISISIPLSERERERERDQVSHQCKTTGKIIGSYTGISISVLNNTV
jgi:hypothetical protein